MDSSLLELESHFHHEWESFLLQRLPCHPYPPHIWRIVQAHGHCSCTLSLETKDADTTSTLTCCLWVVTVSLYVDDSVSFISLQAYRGGKEKSAVETIQVQKDNVGRKSTAFATTRDQLSTNKYGGEKITSHVLITTLDIYVLSSCLKITGTGKMEALVVLVPGHL